MTHPQSLLSCPSSVRCFVRVTDGLSESVGVSLEPSVFPVISTGSNSVLQPGNMRVSQQHIPDGVLRGLGPTPMRDVDSVWDCSDCQLSTDGWREGHRLVTRKTKFSLDSPDSDSGGTYLRMDCSYMNRETQSWNRGCFPDQPNLLEILK